MACLAIVGWGAASLGGLSIGAQRPISFWSIIIQIMLALLALALARVGHRAWYRRFLRTEHA